MTKEIWKGITVLRADDDAYITNGETYTTSAYLGTRDSETNWRDATAEEYAAWRAEQERADTAEEATADDYEAALSRLGVEV